MRQMKFRLMALITGFSLAGLMATPEVSSDLESSVATEQSAAAATEEVPPPVGLPEPAPSVAQFAEITPAAISTNAALEGVVRQIRAGVEEEVLLTYIKSSSTPFHVGSEEIIYLTDLGAPGHIINAMIERDQELQAGQTTASADTSANEPWPAAGTVAQVPAGEDGAAVALAPEGDPVLVEAPSTEMTADYFHGYLAPYGSWIDIPEYGLCWQPSVAVTTSGWIPYGDRGRWVYTNYGWYWYSDYSWGWAAFHYGRWLHHSRWGWCWVPGTVWGPSWVTWRYTDSYCGWAPLPPYSRTGFYFSVGISWGIPSWCYTYVPSYQVCTYYPRKCAVPYARARGIHRYAKAYDNYAVGRNNTIHNRGIPPETLTRDSGAEIRRAHITERSEIPSGTIRRERLNGDGATLTVYRPELGRRSEPTSRQRPAPDETRTTSTEWTFSTATRQPTATRSESSSQRNIRSTGTELRNSPSRTSESSAARSPSASSQAVLQGPSALTLNRNEPVARDRTTSQPVQPRSATTQGSSATAASTERPGGESPARSSSLVVIGRQDAASSSAGNQPLRSTTSSPNAVTRNYSSGSIPTSTSRATVRTEPSSQSRAIRSWGSSTAPTGAGAVSTRSLPALPTRSATQPANRSLDFNRMASPPSRVTTQPTPRSSYTPPPPRSVPLATSPRTIGSPVQSVRPSQSLRTPMPANPSTRSPATYSAPVSSSRTPAPAAPRSAPAGRSTERSSGRNR